MHARVSTYSSATIDPADAERLVEEFRSVIAPLEEMDGFSHAYFLVDRASGKAMSITIWESEDALVASSAKADEIRKAATERGGGSIASVEHFEVATTAGSRSGVA